VFPTYERDPAPPASAPACPACAGSLHFTHYDAWRVPLGELVAVSVFVDDLVVLFAMALLAGVAVYAFGVAWMVAALLLAAPLAFAWKRRRLAQQAVWYCRPCDRHFIGRATAPWKSMAR
jgi:hypothetical protein